MLFHINEKGQFFSRQGLTSYQEDEMTNQEREHYFMFGHGLKESFGGGSGESGFIFLSSWKHGDGYQDQFQCRKLMTTQASPFLGSSSTYSNWA